MLMLATNGGRPCTGLPHDNPSSGWQAAAIAPQLASAADGSCHAGWLGRGPSRTEFKRWKNDIERAYGARSTNFRPAICSRYLYDGSLCLDIPGNVDRDIDINNNCQIDQNIVVCDRLLI